MAADRSVGRAEAMRQSMLELIDRGAVDEAHPAFWATFVKVPIESITKRPVGCDRTTAAPSQAGRTGGTASPRLRSARRAEPRSGTEPRSAPEVAPRQRQDGRRKKAATC